MMRFQFWALILLGACGLVGVANPQVLAEEGQAVPVQAPSELPTAPPSTEMAVPQQEEVPPVLPTPDSESLAQNAPILPTPDSEAAAAPAPAPEYRGEEPSRSYDDVAAVPEETYGGYRRGEASAETIDNTSASDTVESAAAPEVNNEPVDDSGSVRESNAVAQAPDSPAIEAPAPIPARPIEKRESTSKTLTKKLSLGQLSFVCGEVNGTPQTLAKLDKKELGVILWTSTVFTGKGYDPKTRCKQVSARFEAYRANNSLYLTTGKINGQPVICVTSKEDSGCGEGIASNEGMLFTLKPQSDGDATVKQLANALTAEANTPTEPLQE